MAKRDTAALVVDADEDTLDVGHGMKKQKHEGSQAAGGLDTDVSPEELERFMDEVDGCNGMRVQTGAAAAAAIVVTAATAAAVTSMATSMFPMPTAEKMEVPALPNPPTAEQEPQFGAMAQQQQVARCGQSHGPRVDWAVYASQLARQGTVPVSEVIPPLGPVQGAQVFFQSASGSAVARTEFSAPSGTAVTNEPEPGPITAGAGTASPPSSLRSLCLRASQSLQRCIPIEFDATCQCLFTVSAVVMVLNMVTSLWWSSNTSVDPSVISARSMQVMPGGQWTVVHTALRCLDLLLTLTAMFKYWMLFFTVSSTGARVLALFH